MASSKEIQEKIAKLQSDLELAKRAEAVLASQAPECALAIYLHTKLCRWNHTDGCSWHYAIKDGVHDWSEYAHKEYLQKARNITHNLNRLYPKLNPKLNPEQVILTVQAVLGA